MKRYISGQKAALFIGGVVCLAGVIGVVRLVRHRATAARQPVSVMIPVGGQSKLLGGKLTINLLEVKISEGGGTYCAVARVGITGTEEIGIEGCAGSQFQFEKGRFRILRVAVNQIAATFQVEDRGP
jgi:hypothetical protein